MHEIKYVAAPYVKSRELLTGKNTWLSLGPLEGLESFRSPFRLKDVCLPKCNLVQLIRVKDDSFDSWFLFILLYISKRCKILAFTVIYWIIRFYLGLMSLWVDIWIQLKLSKPVSLMWLKNSNLNELKKKDESFKNTLNLKFRGLRKKILAMVSQLL